jgi:hypothetical protein
MVMKGKCRGDVAETNKSTLSEPSATDCACLIAIQAADRLDSASWLTDGRNGLSAIW